MDESWPNKFLKEPIIYREYPTLKEHIEELEKINNSFRATMQRKEWDPLVKIGAAKEGEKYIGEIPGPTDPKEAWERMVNHMAKQEFLSLQFDHLSVYDSYKLGPIEEEIKRLSKFKEKAAKCSVQDAFTIGAPPAEYIKNDPGYINRNFKNNYLLLEHTRISEGFYENRNVFRYSVLDVAKIYAKYFLWLPFLIHERDEMLKNLSQHQNDKGESKKQDSKEEGKNSGGNDVIQLVMEEEHLKEFLKGAKKFFAPAERKDLEKLLSGGVISGRLKFKNDQIKWVEVFRRLMYNGFIVSKKTKVRDWLCDNFEFYNEREKKVKPFNRDTVYDHLSKTEEGIVSEDKLILKFQWLPYKSPD